MCQLANALNTNQELRLINPLIERQRRIQEQIDKALGPQLRIQKQLADALAPQRELQERIDKILEPQRRIQRQLDKAFEPYRVIQQQLSEALAPHRRVLEQINKNFPPPNQVDEQLRRLSELVSNIQLHNVRIFDEDAASQNVEERSIDYVAEEVAELQADLETANEFELLQIILDWLSQFKGTAQAIALYVLLPYVVSLVATFTSPLYEQWWNDFASLPPRVAAKEIVREANQNYSPQELESYRFVAANILDVRSIPNSRANIVDKLPLGKTILLLRQKRRWSLIEYRDSVSGDVKRGWVFTRYLSSLSR